MTYLALSQEEKEQLLTPKRIQLLKTIRRGNGLSVSELAREVNRDPGAVSRDLKVLANHDIIELERSGHRKEAKVAASHIVIPLGHKEGKEKSKVR
ncbi:MarR family transcriptional regulator [Candidatus Bipolaricaulota bacterium]|nr:MarR family transcriptional regulator [Candidatus Bipolaricaulota bacterium]